MPSRVFLNKTIDHGVLSSEMIDLFHYYQVQM